MLVDWIIEVCHDLAPALDSIVHTAVAAVDLFMHRCDVQRRDLQLVRGSASSVAT